MLFDLCINMCNYLPWRIIASGWSNWITLHRMASQLKCNCIISPHHTWWRHQIETCSTVLALCAGNSPVTGEFPSQRPVTRTFDVFFDTCLNKPRSKQIGGWWFDTPSRSSRRHFNEIHWVYKYAGCYEIDKAKVKCNKYCSIDRRVKH